MWISTIPTRPELCLDEEDFRFSMCNRLRVPPFPFHSSCVCGQAATPDHFLTCPQLRRRSTTLRHNNLLALLNSFLQSSGFSPRLEVRDPDGMRPDLRFALDFSSIVLIFLSLTLALLLSSPYLLPNHSVLRRSASTPKGKNTLSLSKWRMRLSSLLSWSLPELSARLPLA